MDETDILSRIHSLVEEEHQLREAGEHTDEQRARIGKLETDLDQCWDLLRQRRAATLEQAVDDVLAGNW